MVFREGFTSEEQFAFPRILNVCVYKGACTANCVHCPLGRTERRDRKAKFGSSSMGLDLFRRIADEVSRYPHATLRIHGVGEPTLWMELPEALEYARAAGVVTWLFTNAITKDRALLRKLVESCHIVEVSVNSCDSDDYAKSKGVRSFNAVAENIRFLHEQIERNHLATRLLLSRVETDDKERDLRFLDYWRRRKVATDVFVRSYHSYNSIIDNKLERAKTIICNVHWSRFNIDTTGAAVVCYNELFRGPSPDPKMVLGNVREQSIREIWQGERLSKIREAQYMSRPELIDFADGLPCDDCRYCQPLNSTKPTSEVQIAELRKRELGQ